MASDRPIDPRERYDASIAERFALLAQNAMDQVSDALQAMTWAAPGDDDLTALYQDACRLAEAIEGYRLSEGHTDR